MSNKTTSATSTNVTTSDFTKDENGRLPAECYTADTISANIVATFRDGHVPKQAGLDMLTILLGEELTNAEDLGETIVADLTHFSEGLVEIFTSEGATIEEVKAGALHVRATIAKFDDESPIAALLKAMADSAKDNADDSHENLH